MPQYVTSLPMRSKIAPKVVVVEKFVPPADRNGGWGEGERTLSTLSLKPLIPRGTFGTCRLI